jgi:N-acetylmuramoyl-L-alanine amidase
MLRRNFTLYMFYTAASGFLFSKNLLAKLTVKLRTSSRRNQLSSSVKITSQNFRIDTQIPLWQKWKYDFISIEDFAQAMHYGFYTNDQKRKSVLYLDKDRITFTADNTFIKWNDQIIQMPLECLWQKGEVWVAIEYLSQLLNKYSVLHVYYNKAESEITIEQSEINITGIRIAAKENGTLIQVFTTRKFGSKDIVLDIRNGYFHIDIYGGKIDKENIAATEGTGIVSKVEGFQLGETASIAFKLKKNIISKELVFDNDSNDFYVNLRTQETIAKESGNEKLKSDLEEQKKRWLIDTIVLDAGHGGKDPGAIGFSKYYEKNIVLPITLQLGQILQEKMPDMKIVYTRKKDVFIPLWKRTKIANDVDANLFVSIHCNSNKSNKANGYETYFLSADKDEKATDVVMKENSAIQFEESEDRERYEGLTPILATLMQSANIKQSQYLASQIQFSLKKRLDKLGMADRGVKQGPFWVLVGATMPNILIETGYISNKYEEKLLKQSTTQKKIAEAIFEGIQKYKEDIESVI